MTSLRAALARKSVVTAVVVLGIGYLLTWLGGGGDGTFRQVAWAIVFAIGVGVFTLWRSSSKIRAGILAALSKDLRLVPVAREEAPGIDWAAIDRESIALEARGWKPLGDFRLAAETVGGLPAARLLASPDGTQVVEIQAIATGGRPSPLGPGHEGVHFNVMGVLGGRIAVMASDRPMVPIFFVQRSPHTVSVAMPGKPLAELVAQHARLLHFLEERTGQPVMAGLDFPRYQAINRERYALARERVARLSGWALAGEHDRFAAEGATKYGPDESTLRALPRRDWSELEAQQAGLAAPAVAAPASPAQVALSQRVASGANWFYWIAGLSLVNEGAALLGSDWGFIFGLGFTQVLTVIAKHAATDGANLGAAIAYGVAAFACGLFLLAGWLARRQSVAAFVAGMLLFALDTLIFVLAGDWIGVAFHAFALYCLYTGLAAARAMKSLAAAPQLAEETAPGT